mgnify:CR=1 FL=1
MEKNVFLYRRKQYKFEGCFDSDKSEKEIDEILDNLGFYMFKYKEISKVDTNIGIPLKYSTMGRPLKYSREQMSMVVNKEKPDNELRELIGVKTENLIRNHRSRWIKYYPQLLKNKNIKEKVE